MLGSSKQQSARVFSSYSYTDLTYLEYLSEKFTSTSSKQQEHEPGEEVKMVVLRHLKFRLSCGKNILHIFSTNHKFL